MDQKINIVFEEPTTVVNIKKRKGIGKKFDVYIGRACNMGSWKLKKSKWANPYSVKMYGIKAIPMYKEYLLNNKELMNDIMELDGKILGCWCEPNDCHGDVLIEIIDSKKRI